MGFPRGLTQSLIKKKKGQGPRLVTHSSESGDFREKTGHCVQKDKVDGMCACSSIPFNSKDRFLKYKSAGSLRYQKSGFYSNQAVKNAGDPQTGML